MAVKTKAKSRSKKEEVVEELADDEVEVDEEEDDDEDVELEDLDGDVEEDEAPTKKKAATPEIEFGVADLAKYLSAKMKKEFTTRELRSLIRKMAREDKPRVKRVIEAGNRTRYDWPGGLKNPEVKAIVKAVLGGEIEADKRAKLEALKESKAKKTSKKTKKKKKVAEPEPEELDDDDIEEIELDDDEDDE